MVAIPVNVKNFVRAETDMYFARSVTDGAFGKLRHRRTMTPIDHQDVVRMNRDTLYSSGVFDLDAGAVTVTLPEPGKRFMSLQVISQDHFAVEVVYPPGRFIYGREKVGTRYVMLVIRTLANPEDPEDLKSANLVQDAIKTEQARAGSFQLPEWDSASQTAIRDALSTLGSFGGTTTRFGTKDEVDPISHLIGAAIGWGGNPDSAATYVGCHPAENDGRTAHELTLKDVPVDGFWSVSVYNAAGYFEKNPQGTYSVNSLTASPNADGSVTVQFGGDRDGALNYLPIMPGWNYLVRLYRPRKALLDGSWKCPEARRRTR